VYHYGRWAIKTSLDVQYDIVETTDVFDPGNPELGLLPDGKPGTGTRLVVLDHSVDALFGERIREYFATNHIPVDYINVPAGDEHKTMEQVLRIVSKLNDVGTYRVGSPPIAIGGGVLQDVVGMAASLYRRGIPYVRVPTTLLGQIDGSVSAKNGVNYEGFRNRLGTFAPPPRTIIDRGLLATLPARQVRSGLGEALKIALIKDARLFELLEAHGPVLVAERLQDSSEVTRGSRPGREVVHRSIAGMAEELQKNLWETDLRRIVDYGHTFSPIVEMKALPELLHGEAVAMDCVFGAVLSRHRGLLTDREVERIVATTVGIGLAPSHAMFCDTAILATALADTVRHRNNEQHVTLLSSIGDTVFVNDLTEHEIALAANRMAQFLEMADFA